MILGHPITPKINNKIIPIFTLKRETKAASAVFFTLKISYKIYKRKVKIFYFS